MAQVTAGWAMMNFRKYCAQLAQPISFTQGGKALPRVRSNNAPSGEGPVDQHRDALFCGER